MKIRLHLDGEKERLSIELEVERNEDRRKHI
jgi:hypothetical protein